MGNIVQLGMNDVKKASAVLDRAFFDDPLFSTFVPNPSKRKAKSHHIYETLVRYSIKYGEVYASSSSFEAIAVWLPHNKVEMNFWNGLRSGGLANIINLGLSSVFRQLTASNITCTMHKTLAPYPHQYLYLIGVEPELRGNGYSGLLIKSMLTRLDNEGLPCYLDNTKEANLEIYEHYGFKIIKKYEVPKTMISLWAMIREPGGV
jgi:GNAT superfamily N-acetyltransferase